MDSKDDRGAGSSSRPESRGPLSQVKKRASTPKPENDFLCQPRYSFTPPEAEMDLKLIDFEPDLSFYAPLETSALDLKHQRPILTDPTHGVRVNLVDLDEYREYQEGEGPDPEDLILLDPESDANEKSFRRKTSGSAPFLRAMFYDEYKIDKIDYSGAASKRQREVKKKTRDELLRDVLAEFQACKKKPVHPNSRKKHLKPVEITPFLPDFENYFIKYVLVHFEDDPKENVRPALERNLNRKEAMGAEDLREMVNTAVTLGRRGEDNEAVLSFYTPVDDEIEKRRKQRQTPGELNESWAFLPRI
uniref:RNA polymerase II-associated factor 1 homolog n=1 Tax=Rhodosorus marinus TaxID=101924 RepID=A0A7S2ZJR4_9RHOD|mmetsp:Transcript_21917/g.89121  ORF Transcript_21917/g.89121 Transcript_21917/m.89121 type:complete len:304 (+) Transcript_21917:77-988(+)